MHNIMKVDAPLPEWERMLLNLELSARDEKVERWENSEEGLAYKAAHPNSFFPRGL